MPEPQVTVTATGWEVQVGEHINHIEFIDDRLYFRDGRLYLIHRGRMDKPWRFHSKDQAVAFLIRRYKARMRLQAAQTYLTKVEAAA